MLRKFVWQKFKTHYLADIPKPTRVWRGPFRGAIITMNPQHSLRKMFGVYEHELNPWLNDVLRRVTRVLDVGANDGYFSFGCAAAFRRMGRTGEVIAFEPEEEHTKLLQRSIACQPGGGTHISLVQTMVGRESKPGMQTLDATQWRTDSPNERANTLIKIDAEGAELDVLAGASTWMNTSNYFLIEVHHRSFLDSIPRLFAARGLHLTKICQKAIPLLGREIRDVDNWWLVTRLDKS